MSRPIFIPEAVRWMLLPPRPPGARRHARRVPIDTTVLQDVGTAETLTYPKETR